MNTPKVIAPLHGIRTTANWHSAFADAVQRAGWKCDLERWYYGKYSLLRFLFPWQRSSRLGWFRDTYTKLKNDNSFELSDSHLPSIVAHSFGTYILGYALVKFPNIKFDKIILCGSILPKDFPWNELLERGQVTAVRNEYGSDDTWSDIVRWFVKGTGPSGKTGFARGHPRLSEEQFSFKHSDYFERGHMDDYWIPFLRKEIVINSPHASAAYLSRPNTPWALYAIYLIIGILVIFVTPLEKSIGSYLVPTQSVTPATSSLTPASPQNVVPKTEYDAVNDKLQQTRQQLDAAHERATSLQAQLNARTNDLNNERQARLLAEHRANSLQAQQTPTHPTENDPIIGNDIEIELIKHMSSGDKSRLSEVFYSISQLFDEADELFKEGTRLTDEIIISAKNAKEGTMINSLYDDKLMALMEKAKKYYNKINAASLQWKYYERQVSYIIEPQTMADELFNKIGDYKTYFDQWQKIENNDNPDVINLLSRANATYSDSIRHFRLWYIGGEQRIRLLKDALQ